MTKSALLDASACLAWIFGEQGAADVEVLLHLSVITSVNLAEVLQVAERKKHTLPPERLQADLQVAGVGIVDVTVEDSKRIAELLALPPVVRRDATGKEREYRLSLGDAVCLAVGERLQLVVITGEESWDGMAKRGDLKAPVQLFR